ncbi:MAG: cytochrome c551/c552/cytochrome c553 [Janthinobacterium sp.]|jgi:cytochrome c551/c552
MRTITISTCRTAAAVILFCSLAGNAQAGPAPDVGRAPTAAELKAWDIDVRADFKGLPKGSGSVKQGEKIWEASCVSCHGTFAESNQVFTPLVGGTTADDIKTGHVASLAKGDVPQRSTMMKLAHMSTLWDYINRAMPWNAPKSLTTDEVYAVTAYLLQLGEVVPGDFVLSDQNIAEVQQRLPNRNGLMRVDDMWRTNGKGDVKNIACMKNCPTDVKVTSFLPDSARNAHGNLAEQNRLIGQTRGTDTTVAPGKAVRKDKPDVKPDTAAAPASDAHIMGLLKANNCTACHAVGSRLVGPGFNEIAAKYKNRADLKAYLAMKIKNGGSGVWGPMPMPPQPNIKEADVNAIAGWIADGAQ